MLESSLATKLYGSRYSDNFVKQPNDVKSISFQISYVFDILSVNE